MLLDLNLFRQDFFTRTKDWTWQIQGFIDQENRVYPIDSDTKVLSTVFERLASPVVRSVGESQGYIIETANQTTYPDFTLSKYDANQNLLHRIGLDIKTTYTEKRKTSFSPMLFTLGSYKSFIRNNTKNILYPYNTYDEHWVLGFVYTRSGAFEEYNLDNIPERGAIACPYNIESIFFREKHAITGLRAGSGNTANIGSIKVKDPADFSTENGPFTNFSFIKSACDYYWCNYERLKNAIKTERDLLEHPEFQQFK
ncbi:MAG: restriction endonuclease [Bacteroidetes bacterium]|nr:restriction endonuclease [Bacteroidota bacterium]